MSIDTGQPKSYDPNYPVAGVAQSSKQFRDNFAIIKRAVENLQAVSSSAESVLKITSTVDVATGAVVQTLGFKNNAFRIPVGDIVGEPQLGMVRIKAGIFEYYNGVAWVAPSGNGTIEGATLDSPTFTGIPKAPTAPLNTNTTQIATTAFVQRQIQALNINDLDLSRLRGPVYIDNHLVFHAGNLNLVEVIRATENFNKGNDRNTTAIAQPVIDGTGQAIDHVERDDGSVDISFEWTWPPPRTSGVPWTAEEIAIEEGKIDGFIVYQNVADTGEQYVFGNHSKEFPIFLPANSRAFFLRGVAANKYYTFGIRGFRKVDPDLVPAGVILSPLSAPTLASENPYLPSANVAFKGNIIGTVNGTPVATVTNAVTNFNNRNDRIATTPVTPKIRTDGLAVDHDKNTDGSVDISFEWIWPPKANDTDPDFTAQQIADAEATIDGFFVYYHIKSTHLATDGEYLFDNPSQEYVIQVPANQRAIILPAVSAMKYYAFAVRTYRIVDSDISPSGYKFSALARTSSTTNENPFRPEDHVAFEDINMTILDKNGVPMRFSKITDTATNFDKRNDRLSATDYPIPLPVIDATGLAIDHTRNKDGSVNISFEWSWTPRTGGSSTEIDGFIVYQHVSTNNVEHTFTTPSSEVATFVERNKRAIILPGVSALNFYSFGVRAYRNVDPDIDPSGFVMTPIVTPTYNGTFNPDGSRLTSGEKPYQPATSIEFDGDIIGTIAGIPVGSIKDTHSNFNKRNDRMGEVYAIPAPVISAGNALDVTNAGGDAVTHILNADGSANISLNWTWAPPASYSPNPLNITPSEADIDGFMVYTYSRPDVYNDYVFGTDVTLEDVSFVPANIRRFSLRGVPANHYYTFAVKAYRIVDPDVDGEGYVFSPLTPTSHASETPYQPSDSVNFTGNLGGRPVTEVLAKLDAAAEADITAPGIPGAPSLSSTIVVDSDGTQRVRLKATWTRVTDAHYYELAIKEGTGSFVEFSTTGGDPALTIATYTWDVLANTHYEVKVRALDALGNRSGWSPSTHIDTLADTLKPSAPTNLAAAAAFRSIFLSWDSPSTNADATPLYDLRYIEVYENVENNVATATRIATVAARAGAKGTYTRSGLTTNSTRWYWVAAVDTSGNRSAYSGVASETTSYVPTTDLFGKIGETQIDDGSISLLKFGTDLRPVEIVTALPTTNNVIGRVVLFQNKIYRYVGISTDFPNGWSAAVPFADLTGTIATNQILANTIKASHIDTDAVTAGKIQAGAVTASKVAARAITAKALAIGDFENQAFNGQFQMGPDNWSGSLTAGTPLGSFSSIIEDAINGYNGSSWVLKLLADVAARYVVNDNRFAVKAGEELFLSWYAKASAIVGATKAYVLFLNSAGLEVSKVDVGSISSDQTAYQHISGVVVVPANAVIGVAVIEAAHTAGTVYIGEITLNRRKGGHLIVDGTITANKIKAEAITTTHMKAGTIHADRLQAGTLTADRFTTTGADVATNRIPSGIYVGDTGVQIGSVENPALRINAKGTLIEPGVIKLTGTTTLRNWMVGGDSTQIDGGSIAANTIAANKLTVGLRGLTLNGLQFQAELTTPNRLEWSGGSIEYVSDTGTQVPITVNPGFFDYVSGTVYIYWIFGQNSLLPTTTTATAHGSDRIVLATYRGGVDFIAHYGRTIIDGSQITTGSITADRIRAGSIFTQKLFLGAQDFVLDGKNGGDGKGALLVYGPDPDGAGAQVAQKLVTIGWIDSGTVGFQLRNNAGQILLDHSYNPDQINNSSVYWGQIQDPSGTKPADGATRNVLKGAWASGVAYIIGDMFTYGGATYSVTVAHTSSDTILPPNDVPGTSATPRLVLFASAGLSTHLSRYSAILPKNSDGLVTDYSSATAEFTALSGGTNVSTDFTLSETPGGNPQALTVTFNNTANPRSFAITGGFDTTEETATIKIRATGVSGSSSGIVIDNTFTLTKVGGIDSTPPANVATPTLSSSVTTNLQALMVASWTANTDGDLAYYIVAISQNTGTDALPDTDWTQAVEHQTTKSRYEWRLPPNTKWKVRVKAVDRAGNPSALWSGVAAHTTVKDNVAPSAPTLLAAAAGFNAIALSWLNPTADDLSHIEVYERADSTQPTATDRIATVQATSGTEGRWTRSGLKSGVTRHYWLKAVDTSGNASELTGYNATTATYVSVSKTTSGTLVNEVETYPINVADQLGNILFGPNGAGTSGGFINENVHIVMPGGSTPSTILLTSVAANSLVPAINYVGEYSTPPTETTLGSKWKQNAVYKNSTDGHSYVLTGSPLGWVIYISDGKMFSVVIESSNGTVFRRDAGSQTTLKARVFKNGAEVTDVTPEAWFAWRRVSAIPREAPNDDATWNSLYASGYKQVLISVDDVYARATFFVDIAN